MIIDSNHSSNLVNGVLVNNTDSDINVNLIATVSSNTDSDTKNFTVTISETIIITPLSYYDDIDLSLTGNDLLLDLRDLITTTYITYTSYNSGNNYL